MSDFCLETGLEIWAQGEEKNQAIWEEIQLAGEN